MDLKKNTGKVALCGVMSAFAVSIMLLSYFPALTYAIPAIAGVVFIILVIETDYKWALCAYAASSVLVLLLAEPEAKLMFVAFFGYYPIIKGCIERLRKPIIEIIIKFAVFNVAIVAAYLIIIYVFGIPMEELGELGKYSVWILLGMGNVTFLVYDFAVSRIVELYIRTLHKKLKKLIK